ncbi:MAG TPA: hypothetical protein VE967_02480, partial [Gemmatimonadaceae bacterium]|nr:hypothetical protein [Gemmatimonadaceae bacterium]
MPTGARLAVKDRVVLAVFVIVWLFSLTMRAAGITRPPANWFYVERVGTGGYPVVQGFLRPDADTVNGVHRGDRVVRVGGTDARGLGQVRFQLTVEDESWRARDSLAFTVERGGGQIVVNEPRIPLNKVREYNGIIIALVWGIAAILIRLRARPSPTTNAVFAGLACYAVFFVSVYNGPYPVAAASLATLAVTSWGVGPLLVFAYLSFPEEASALGSRWHRTWPWIFAISGNVYLSTNAAFPLAGDFARTQSTWPTITWIAALAYAITRNFRRSGPLGRRQIKWILYAVYAGTLLALISYAAVGTMPANPPAWTQMLILLASLGFPVSMLIAVLRSNLFDIDRLLGATVSYNLLAFAAVGVALLLLPVISETL